MIDHAYEESKGKSVQTETQKERRLNRRNPRSENYDRCYGLGMTSKGNESGNRNGEKLKDNYETDLTKMKINSEIEKFLQLRRRLEKKDIYRVQRTYLDVDRNAK